MIAPRYFLTLNRKKLPCPAMMRLWMHTIGHANFLLTTVLINMKVLVLHKREKNHGITPLIGNASHIVDLDLAHVRLMVYPAYKMKKILLNTWKALSKTDINQYLQKQLPTIKYTLKKLCLD